MGASFLILLIANFYVYSTAKQAAADALAVKTASGSKAKVIVPGTPRHSGIGAGSRVTQTPRRRVGI